MNKTIKYLFFSGVLICFIMLNITKLYAQQSLINNATKTDTLKLKYPFKDFRRFPFSNSGFQSGLYLGLPSNIKSEIIFDADNYEYSFTQKMGNLNFRTPHSMTLDEYRKYELNKYVKDTWRQKFKNENFESQRSLIPKLRIGGEAFDKIFGGNTINIRPQGTAELIFGLNISRNDNPVIPEKLRRTTTFDFKNNIMMNVTGQIGQKVNVGVNYNTQATFDFENKTNLAYNGLEDEIIKKIEAGNVSLPLSGSLIQGSQSLFGLKTEMQFGRLTVTSVFSQQKGESSVIEVEGGAQLNEFEISASDYETNKHFFLSHYFKDNYDQALRALPVINSGVTITRIEVWVTNKTSDFNDSRNVLALLDLAEGNTARDTNIFATDFVRYNPPERFPSNGINDLYSKLVNNYSGIRNFNRVTEIMSPLSDQYNFVTGQDFEKIENARKLKTDEFDFHPNLGYISLKSGLINDEILAVAYEYTIAGEVFRVGEFSNEMTTSPESDNPTLILKLLKGTNLSPALPTWELMMKNIYSMNAFRVKPQDFYLDVLYQNDKTGTAINYIPGGAIDGEILLKVLNLDNLNFQMDPQPDGIFDFINRITINAENGRIIFPVREPFGEYLRRKIEDGDPENKSVADEYVFEELYSMTQTRAKQMAGKNKFFLSGRYQSSSSSDISLGAGMGNIPQGSVIVTAGGRQLVENQDYTVDYSFGRVKIINEGLLASGETIKISLESQSSYNLQSKTLLGSHFEYKVSNDFSMGGTILHLKERPLTKKVIFGEEPISNTIWGLNTNYRSEAPFLTRLIDKLPFIETKERSTITFNGEFAQLIPGHSKAVGETGISYIDDFEGSQYEDDIKQRHYWVMASVPQFQEEMFPEAELNNNLTYGYNRAKLAWYNIDPLFLRNNTSTPAHLTNNRDEQLSHFTREIQEEEIFPYKESPNNIPQNISVLNLALYPREKGPYNYDLAGKPGYSYGIDSEGYLKNPESRWAGIMRKMRTNDFEATNVEYIEFWLMDPFVEDEKNGVVRNDKDPGLYFNIGNISEDILKDSRKSFENGLPTTEIVTMVDTTIWGRVPLSQSFVNAFDNDIASRAYQDKGLDGINDEEERSFFKSYLDSIDNILEPGSEPYNNVYNDPSGDNYHYSRGRDYDTERLGILDRYKMFNGFEGNSPTTEQSPESYPTSSTTLPDAEDINMDNTISESESYFQYKVVLDPDNMNVGTNYITDKVRGKNKDGDPVNWYQFKIPIYEPQKTIGSIQDFKSIRFMRMFLKGFNDNIFLRFAKLDLVRGEWRKYNFSLKEGSEYTSIPQINDGSFEVLAVNIEENASKTPVNYILPPGISRTTDPTNAYYRQQNEQSMVIKVKNLGDGDARAAYKNKPYDFRQYKKLQMDIHAEAIDENMLKDNELVAFIRIGSDYTQNYYEYEVPLALTPHLPASSRYDNYNLNDRYIVWPEQNHMEIEFLVFQQVKQERNSLMRMAGSTITNTTKFFSMDGNNRVIVVGNPNLSNIRTIMIGVRNPNKMTGLYSPDDGLAKTAEVWFNELRLTDFDESGGWAGTARMTARLADFGMLTIAANTLKPGFGSIEKKVNDRSKEEISQYDITSNLELGKFFPQKAGVSIPVYFGFSEGTRNPKYNPLDPDIPLKAALENAGTKEARDSIIKVSQNYNRRKSFNVTNVRISKPGFSSVKPKFYSASNFSASYAFNEIFSRNINTEFNLNKNYSGIFSYNYSDTRSVPWEPFKKSKLFSNKAWKIFKDMNFFYKPSRVTFLSNINRQYSELQLRNVSNPAIRIDPTYNKNFVWLRTYDVKFDLTRNLRLDFKANNNSRIDEPAGRMNKDDDDYQAKRDSIWDNFLDLGRTTKYHHTITTSYVFPFEKIPFLSWIKLSGDYSVDYDWTAGPITADTIDLGNIVQNSNRYNLKGSLNFNNIYNKIGFFKKINQKFSGGRRSNKEVETIKYEESRLNFRANIAKEFNHKLLTEEVTVIVYGKGDQPVDGEVEIINNKRIKFTTDSTFNDARIEITGEVEVKQNPLIYIAENGARMLMGIENLAVTFGSSNGTLLPGYKPEPQILGQRSVNNSMAPGFPFILGFQDEEFGDNAASFGWISTDSTINQAYSMGHSDNITMRSNVKPLPGLTITLTSTRAFTRDMSQYYIFDGENFVAHNQIIGGNFSMTLMTWKTAFKKDIKEGDTYISGVFEQFKENRSVISRRLANQRMDSRQAGSFAYDPNANNDPDYTNGYGPTAQDVLIPAFIAAYTGKDPEKIGLSSFPSITSLIPNWTIKYDGLTKIPALKKYLRSFNISHNYTSRYSVGAYTTNLLYHEEDFDGLNYVRDAQDNFLPEQQIGAISIMEQFSPLIKFDMTWANSLTSNIEIKRSRNLSLSFANNQLIEIRNTEIVGRIGYKFMQVPIIIRAGGQQRKFQSDLQVMMDLSIRDNQTVLRKVSENFNKLSAGSKLISIKFSADYTLSSKLNLRFYYDQIINKPLVSLSFPTSNTKVGISLKFQLAQ